MHRVNIVYATHAQVRFDWKHYTAKHLALACGISSRHAPITFCDVDRPFRITTLGHESIVAICTVYFDDLATQNRFREFFATEHQDSKIILADEPNYTDITPTFNAGVFETHNGKRENQTARLRVLLPWSKNFDVEHCALMIPDLTNFLSAQGIEISCVELDRCRTDVAPNTHPNYAAIFSLYTEHASACAELTTMQDWERQIRGSLNEYADLAHLSLASIEPFDLQQCQAYLEKTP